jgi:hypothetical protein
VKKQLKAGELRAVLAAAGAADIEATFEAWDDPQAGEADFQRGMAKLRLQLHLLETKQTQTKQSKETEA